MRVLVTGGAGYIGSHTVKELLRRNIEVCTLDNLSTGHREAVLGGEFREGDIRDREILREVFSSFRPEAVIHFAASAVVPESVENPLLYWDNNVSGTIILLDEAVRHGVKHVVFSSSAAVYGEPERVPIPEEHPCRPANPYGMTKLVGERILEDCAAAYGTRYASLRYFNASGADPEGRLGEDREVETHLIPIVLKVAAAVKRGERISGASPGVRIFGSDYPTPDGTCIRDYIHVVDLARAHLLALEWLDREKAGGVFNLGNGTGYSVREVVEAAREVTGVDIPAADHPRRPGDPAVLVAGSERIRSVLGWEAQIPGLKDIIATAWRYIEKQAVGGGA